MNSGETMTPDRQKAVFEQELPALLADPNNVGKYALIHGESIDSVWPTLEKAVEEGYGRFGLDAFLVRHIVADEEPIYFPHSVSPCR